MSFVFSEDNKAKADLILKRYPEDRKRSAVLPLLHLAQEQKGYICGSAINEIAKIVEIEPIKVKEVVSFYSMFREEKVGKNFIEFCQTAPCSFVGQKQNIEFIKKELEINENEISKDELFTFTFVECLGNCTNAPVAQINGEFQEKLSTDKLKNIINNLKNEK